MSEYVMFDSEILSEFLTTIKSFSGAVVLEWFPLLIPFLCIGVILTLVYIFIEKV